MILKKSIPAIFIISILCSLGFGIPSRIERMVAKEVHKVFESNEVIFKTITVADSLNAQLPVKITSDNFQKVIKENTILGYYFVDKAPSKTADFDYLVIFNPNLEIIHSKILIYREEYGGEIGSKRWLKQFIGLTGKDRVSYETNIDGIAGATISVRSMTIAMDNLLHTVGILQKKQFFE